MHLMYRIQILIFVVLSSMGCKSTQKQNGDKVVKLVPTTQTLEVRNDVLLVKLDLTRGGAINYISLSDTTRNLVNIHDEGRYIQQSYYAGQNRDRTHEGQNSNWSPWAWNPIQVGDSYNNRAKILEYRKKEQELYVKCIPMLWDMNNEPAEAVMEQWLTLTGNVIKVHNKLTCNRTDIMYGNKRLCNQELPAVYPISVLKNLYSYFGDAPFTNKPLSTPKVKKLRDGFWGKYKDDMVTEHWMAFVDDNKWGMGVYTPISSNFLAGMAGNPGYETLDSHTSYIAPVKMVALEKNDSFEYDYYIIIGSVDEIRSTIYKINNTLKKTKK